MRLHVIGLATLGLVSVLLGAGCKKAADQSPPPKAAAPAAEAPAAEAPAAEAPAADAPAAAAEAPAAPTDPAAEIAAQRNAKAAELEAQRKADPSALAAAPGAEGGTADCESGKQFDALSLAQQQAEMARKEAVVVAAKVREMEGKVQDLLLEALKRQAEQCKAGALDASCVGAASGDPRGCESSLIIGSAEECRVLATLRKAILAKDGSACSSIEAGPIRATCIGGATGKYDCDEKDTSKEAQTCRLLAKGGEPKCDASDGGAESCAGFWMLLAMKTQDASVCENVPTPRRRNHCIAIATGDSKKCSGGGPIPLVCREVMLSMEVQEVSTPDGPQYVANLKALNLYDDLARCKVVLSVRQGQQDTSMEKDMGTLAPGSGVRTFSWPLEGMRSKPLLLAGTSCTWEAYTRPPTEAPATP